MKKYTIVVVALIIGLGAGLYFQPLISEDNVYSDVKKFSFVLNKAMQNYVDEVDTHKLTEAAIQGMLEQLDVHSVYISAEEMKRVEEDFKGSFDGIGVQFDIINDTITIISPIADGPSERLGIMSGDKILTIDGENAVGINRDEVPKKLRGPKGTIVKVDIMRGYSKDLIPFSITRDKIPLYSVDAKFMINNTDIGYVQINRFSATTHQELVGALDELSNQGMKKLVLDLRSNPGGFLTQAFMMADEFLGRGDTIVYTKGREDKLDEVYLANAGQKYEKIPIICLVNAGSASASEIVSGAIQDHDRGLIVGETSYGKGLVQRQFEIGDGSAFRLTISKYYTPSGRCIQRPYKDADKYRHLAGRLELEEGSYINNSIDKIKNQLASINKDKKEGDKEYIDFESLPLYKTRTGRTVFGGGGVTPDYIVKSDTITKFSASVRRANLYFEFANSYLASSKGKALKSKYEENFKSFVSDFELDSKSMSEFKELAKSKGVEWDENSYKIDEDYFQKALKATIARILWDSNSSTQIFSQMDTQLHKAIELFPEAEKIAKLK